jgi:hypothetical protein
MVHAQQMPPTSGLMRTVHWYRFIKRTIVHFGTPFDEQSPSDLREVQESIVETGADLNS